MMLFGLLPFEAYRFPIPLLVFQPGLLIRAILCKALPLSLRTPSIRSRITFSSERAITYWCASLISMWLKLPFLFMQQQLETALSNIAGNLQRLKFLLPSQASELPPSMDAVSPRLLSPL